MEGGSHTDTNFQVEFLHTVLKFQFAFCQCSEDHLPQLNCMKRVMSMLDVTALVLKKRDGIQQSVDLKV